MTTRGIFLAVLLLADSLLLSRAAAAPGDENWDPSFGSIGANGAVMAITVIGNDVYIGGSFTSVGGTAATNLAKWDGTNWSQVGGGVDAPLDGVVNALSVAGPFLFVGGSFSRAGDLPVSNIVKWNGTNWETLGSGLDRGVGALAFSDGMLYAGGSFRNAGQIKAMHVAKWDGINWSWLGSGITHVTRGEEHNIEDGAVDALAVWGTNVFVGGEFDFAGSLKATNIAVWNGTFWAPLGSGVDAYVRALAVSQNGLYVGGDFRYAAASDPMPTRVPGTAGIAKWTGTNWESVGGEVSDQRGVRGLCLCGNDLYAAGNFLEIGGVATRTLAKWDGTKWSPLGSSISGGGPIAVACAGTQLCLGGIFSGAGGKPSTNIALWHIPVTLKIKRSGSKAELTWPASASDFVVEANDSLSQAVWTPLASLVATQDVELVVTDEISGPSRFYRLHRR